MGLAVVLGVLLKVESIGYDGASPLQGKAPIKVEEGRSGQRTFIYDLSPAEENLAVEDCCARIGSRLERMLAASEAAFAARLTLEFGILADREDVSFSYSWPPDFLRALADADIALNVSHYLPSPDKKGDESQS